MTIVEHGELACARIRPLHRSMVLYAAALTASSSNAAIHRMDTNDTVDDAAQPLARRASIDSLGSTASSAPSAKQGQFLSTLHHPQSVPLRPASSPVSSSLPCIIPSQFLATNPSILSTSYRLLASSSPPCIIPSQFLSASRYLLVGSSAPIHPLHLVSPCSWLLSTLHCPPPRLSPLSPLSLIPPT